MYFPRAWQPDFSSYVMYTMNPNVNPGLTNPELVGVPPKIVLNWYPPRINWWIWWFFMGCSLE